MYLLHIWECKMSKFELVEKLKEYGFSDSDLLDMFIYWSDVSTVEECVEDFLNDRNLSIDDGEISYGN